MRCVLVWLSYDCYDEPMKRVSWWGAMIGVVFTISVMQSDPATSLSWAESDNTLVYERTMPSPPSEYRGIPGCVDMPMTVLGYMELQSMCVYTAPDVLFAVPSRFSGTESGLYVSVSGEPFVRIVGSDEGGSYLVRPGTNTLITIRYFGETSMLSISIDMHKHLTRHYGYSEFEYEYLAGSSPGGFWLDGNEYDTLHTRSMQMTPDGKYFS